MKQSPSNSEIDKSFEIINRLGKILVEVRSNQQKIKGIYDVANFFKLLGDKPDQKLISKLEKENENLVKEFNKVKSRL